MIETEIVNKEKQSSELLDFCSKAGLLTSDEAHVNMFHKNWHDRPETLPYVLYLSKRFAGDNGEFFLLRINGKIEGISGGVGFLITKSGECRFIGFGKISVVICIIHNHTPVGHNLTVNVNFNTF